MKDHKIMASDKKKARSNKDDAKPAPEQAEPDMNTSQPSETEDLSSDSSSPGASVDAGDAQAGSDAQEPSFEQVAADMAEAIEQQAGATSPPDAAAPMDMPELDVSASGARRGAGLDIDLLRDVELNVKIELGRSRMTVDEVLRLGEGSVVELDKLAGDPVDVFVNDRLIARGEVLVLNDNFCVRINEIIEESMEAVS
jgi:flagellar motor switch protein FliN/FliY